SASQMAARTLASCASAEPNGTMARVSMRPPEGSDRSPTPCEAHPAWMANRMQIATDPGRRAHLDELGACVAAIANTLRSAHCDCNPARVVHPLAGIFGPPSRQRGGTRT